jgi:flagellar basal-body rod modification protein FlgD
MAITTDALAQSAAASAATGKSGSAAGNAGTRLAENFDQFLTLLTAQLKNQDPTNPLDTNEFTNQLVAFAQVEQQIATNTNLESLVDLNRTNQITALAPMVGKRVEIDGPDLPLQGGAAEFSVDNSTNFKRARIIVTDSAGRIVRDEATNLGNGRQALAWDGRDANGAQLPDGGYQVSVRGLDPKGAETPMTVTSRGLVTAAERSGEGFVLLLGEGVRVAPDKVRSLAAT